MVSPTKKRQVEIDLPPGDQMAAALEKLRELQKELAEVDKEMAEKIEEIESTFNQKKEPIYGRRNRIINMIPDFWFTVVSNHRTLGKLLTEEDKKIMRYLDTLNVESFKYPRKGYCITFNFKVNPYFEDKKLSKTVEYIDGDVITNGTTIKWKEGKVPRGVTREAIIGNTELIPSLGRFAAEDTTIFDQDLIGNLIHQDLWVNPIELNNGFDDEESDDDDEEEEESDDDEEEDND